jgi:hypothetical protein
MPDAADRGGERRTKKVAVLEILTSGCLASSAPSVTQLVTSSVSHPS